MSWLYALCVLCNDYRAATIETPKAADDRMVVELVAQEPEIVTPTGITVDERGRIWVIENQTHHRPADYKGPPGDRIRIYDDFGPDGRARRVRTFAEGFKNGMGLALASNGDLYFATRSEIRVLRDTDQDDVADQQEVIAKLETAGDYPHNGLSGFAFDSLDNVYFGCGENLGASYKLIGSDGTTLSGGGEGGNIYRCRPDGSKLIRVATGFWNPFHLTFDAFGRLFAVDNDPDSRPPCRLLHIVQGGDYGYRFRNGRKGLHPFTAWNGELPGTLPMVAGTGEAPSGIVAYESNGLPPEYAGDLIATSWGDHVIQRFKLRERGASFVSDAETFVRGGDGFYPVGIATAPDGSLVVSDWADKSYPLHGKGRIWRIRMKQPPADDGLRPSTVTNIAERERLIDLLEHPKQEIRLAAARALVTSPHLEYIARTLGDLTNRKNLSSRARIAILHALTQTGTPGVRTGARYSGLWFNGDRPEVWSEYARMMAEVQHPRSRATFPAAPSGTTADTTERLSLEPWATSKEYDPGLRLNSILGLHSPELLKLIIPVLGDQDPFLVSAAIESLGQPGNSPMLLEHAGDESPKIRIGVLLSLRRTGDAEGQSAIANFLDDSDSGIRRAAIQWVAEDCLQQFAPSLEAAATKPPMTRELFEALLAAKELLAGVTRTPTDEPSGEDFILKILGDEAQSSSMRTMALRSLRPDHPALAVAKLRELLSGDPALQLEAVRTLAARSDAASQDILRKVAADSRGETTMRAEASLGLANSAQADDTIRLLVALIEGKNAELRREALRSLRGAAGRSDVKQAVKAWLQGQGRSASESDRELAERLLHIKSDGGPTQNTPLASELGPFAAAAAEPGDAAAGQRVFFHPNGPQCSACHRVNGRGGNVGPDLSVIGRTLDRDKLIRSILEPSKDIAPQFTPWLFALRDGRVVTGVILLDDPRGVVLVGDAQGKTIELNAADIEQRKAQDRSIMPDNIADRMTLGEFRDLVTFLSTLN